MAIIFQATRVTVGTIDFSNALAKIRVNNWVEVSELDFAEFSTGCCMVVSHGFHASGTRPALTSRRLLASPASA
jgi:hypothetical protein